MPYGGMAFAPLTQSLYQPGMQGADPGFLSMLQQGAMQQAQLLNNAQDMRMARGQTATPMAGPGASHPITESIQNAKNLIIQSVLGKEDDNQSDYSQLDDKQKQRVRQMSIDPAVGLNETEGIVRMLSQSKREQRAAKEKGAITEQKEKSFTAPLKTGGTMSITSGGQTTNYGQPAQGGLSPRQQMVEQFKGQIAQEDYDALKATAEDRNITDAQLISQIHQSRRAAASEARQADTEQRRQQHESQLEQYRTMKGMHSDLMQQMKDLREENKQIEAKYKDYGAWGNPALNQVLGKNPEYQQDVKTWQTNQAELQKARATAEHFHQQISGGTQQTGNPAKMTPADIAAIKAVAKTKEEAIQIAKDRGFDPSL